MKTKIFFIFFFSFATLLADDYVKPGHVDQHTWDILKPYFLPANHPIKKRLDSIFSKRVSRSTVSLKEAGFLNPEPRKYSSTVVSKHPNLKGYIVKLYVDDTLINDGQEMLNRIMGALYAKAAIERHGYESYFEVPQKWIYPLPENPAPIGVCCRKNFILIAEDLGVMKKSENYYWFRTDLISKKILDALYVVVQEEGLDDSILPSNIPITRRGKLGFIDTAVYHRWPIRYYLLTQYLAPSKQKYWEKLIYQNGPQ